MRSAWLRRISAGAWAGKCCGDPPEEAVMFTFRLDRGGGPTLGSEGDGHGRAD
jgi:hypothetical protein